MAYRRRLGEQEGSGLDEQLTDQLVPTYGGGDRGESWQTMAGGVEPPSLGQVTRDSTLREDRSNSLLGPKSPDVNSVPTTGGPLPTLSPAPTPAGGGDASRDWRNTLQYGDGPGTLSGFNTNGYGGDQKAANSVKNTFGRIAKRYPNTPEGLRQAMNDPDFKRAFPNARMVEGGAGDKIDFGGVLSDFESGSPVGVVDVGQAFDPSSNSGQAWAWMPDGEGGGGAAGGASLGGGGTLGQGVTIDSLLGGDPMATINEQINGLAGGQDSQIQALIEQILSGQQPQV